jgi:hypothetical protein
MDRPRGDVTHCADHRESRLVEFAFDMFAGGAKINPLPPSTPVAFVARMTYRIV